MWILPLTFDARVFAASIRVMPVDDFGAKDLRFGDGGIGFASLARRTQSKTGERSWDVSIIGR